VSLSAPSWKVRVNGETRVVPEGSLLGGVLAELALDPRLVAVELDGAIVPRGSLADQPLRDGARLEIVRFVQGG
jgi:thiamine biosynthesis protein ThiS